jgi:phenylacetate-coenzyme A ligase PaaK-like adenylate-forming protein
VTSTTDPNLPPEESLDGRALGALQRDKLSAMLREVLATNAFYQQKFRGFDFDPRRDPIHKLPLTTRAELEQSQLDRPPTART